MTANLLDWRRKYRELEKLPSYAPRLEKIRRGQEFEVVLSAMFDEAGLQPRLRYRPHGEEIDGSIWLDGRTILIEAKWTKDPHPASSIYQFKGKVDGKLVGTIGLFISISGFSKDAVDALVLGKELNIVLADGADMRALVDNRISIIEMLRRKLRAAGDTGDVNWTYEAIEASGGSPVGPTPRPPVRRIIVVEGRSDMLYLQTVRRLLGFTGPVTFVPAGGALNVPRQVRALSQGAEPVAITAVVDADVDPRFLDEMRAEFHARSNETGVRTELLTADPDLESVLGVSREAVARARLQGSLGLYLEETLTAEAVLARAREDESLSAILGALA